MPAPFSGIDKALVLSATPQSKAAQETHSGSHALVPTVGAETNCLAAGKGAPSIAQTLATSAPTLLSCSALSRLLPPQRLHSLLSLAPSLLSGVNCSPVWCQERLAADCRLPRALLG